MSDLNLRIAISIHALREEGDPLPCCRGFMLPDFYPRPPRGGRRVPRTRRPQPVHFYPRPPRGGRRVFLDEDQSVMLISIHALREEGDVPRAAAGRQSGISIHALREEGDLHPAPCRGLR